MRLLLLLLALLPAGQLRAEDGAAVVAVLAETDLPRLPVLTGADATPERERWPPGAADALLAERALDHPALAHAQQWLGTPYAWEGRGTRKHPGMDCLGLLYRAWGPVTNTAWTAYPVDPSELVRSELLGRTVPGLAGRLRASVDDSELRPGDVLYLLKAWAEIPDEPLWLQTRACGAGEEADSNALCSTPYWPWHTVVYVDQGVVVHAAPGAEVRTQRLSELDYDALFVTRR